MSSKKQSSYLKCLEFFEINYCLTKVIVSLNKLITKSTYLSFPEIDKELMLSYLHDECLKQSKFCEQVVEIYCPDIDLPKKNVDDKFKFYLNYYLGFVLDGLYYLDYYFTKPALNYGDGVKFALKSFEKSNKILENLKVLIK